MLMSVRLQVVMDEDELADIREIAKAQRLTVSEWVRLALRSARRDQPRTSVRRKLEVIAAAAAHRFPAGDIETMLEEIERGYLTD